jgi:hypothetical protein
MITLRKGNHCLFLCFVSITSYDGESSLIPFTSTRKVVFYPTRDQFHFLADLEEDFLIPEEK